LKALRDRSASLPAARPVELVARPVTPPPSSQEQADIIDAVRKYALEYTSSLPDFLCHETMVTYAAPPRGDSSWTQVSNIDSRLSYFKQKEAYAPYMQDGKFTSQDYEKLKGSKSVGDFGTMLRGIFDPASQAHFEWRGWAAHGNQRAMEFDYRVAQERSNYSITVEGGRSVTPGYHGYFQIDPKSHVIWKLTLVADDLPRDFPVQSAEASLDYEYRDLSGKTFLLPSVYQALMSGPDGRNRIDKKFGIYRKYSADSEISFGDEPAATPPVIKK
jgi:hypothetical protein